MSSAPVIHSLHFYPVKSCKAVDLQSAYVGPRGLMVGKVLDRSWMLIDENNKFVSQRTEPNLARVQIELLHGETGIPEKLRLSAEGHGSIDLDTTALGNQERLVLHGKEIVGHLASGEINQWFSDFLGKPIHAVHQTEEDVRLCDPNFARTPEDAVSFADGFPYLVAGEATLEKLNQELASPVPMRRFRPNIVIGDTAPEAEYSWRTIEVGEARLSLVKPCTRCVMITVDQETGTKTGSEPLKTLGQTAFLKQDFGTARVQGAIFGENAIPLVCGKIAVGDRIVVLETKPAYVFGRNIAPVAQTADQMMRADAVPLTQHPPSSGIQK